jgi:transposase-like protein
MEENHKLNGETKIPPPQQGRKRQFTTEFKKAIQARVKAGEVPAHIAKELNIGEGQIRKWGRGEQMGSFNDPKPKPQGVQAKLQRLQRAQAQRAQAQRAQASKSKSKSKRAQASKSKTKARRTFDDRLDAALGFDDATVQRRISDATKFLTLAENWMYDALRSGEISRFDPAHDYTRQALRELAKLRDM